MNFAALKIDADKLDLTQRKVRINTVALDQPVFSISNYEGKRPDSLRPKDIETSFVNDPAHLRWNPGNWDIAIQEVTLNKGTFKSILQTDEAIAAYFDPSHIEFNEINAHFKQVAFKQDSITANMQLNTRERSGLIVKKLNAQVRIHPEAMEFHQLDLQTNRSHLHNYFAMRYDTF